MVVVVSGIHCLLVRCFRRARAQQLARGAALVSGVLPWCLQTKERKLAGDAQQLAASTACIGSELVACLRGHKKCRKKLLASVL